MFEDSLFTPMEEERIKEVPVNDIFIDFLNQIEGWKTRCKNLHWAAPNRNIHEYLDDFIEVLSEYQDGLAEGYMGITGKMQPNVINGCACNTYNALDFIEEVRDKTLSFYNRIPQQTIYKGIASECETFIQNINKYKYLFGLCDLKTY
jgi:hypothetical protein